MQINEFKPDSTAEREIVVFPARFVIPQRDSTTKFRYTKATRNMGVDYDVISCSFDKADNRVHILCEGTPPNIEFGGSRLKYQLVEEAPSGPVRATFDLKLDIPRGSMSPVKVTKYEIIEAPNLGDGGADGKLRAGDGTIVDIGTYKKAVEVYKTIYEWLRNYYNTNGCPADVDRRKLQEPLKGYTGELRNKWRVDAHNFGYPASGLATAIADRLTGRCTPPITMDQLIELHLIPGYPTITMVRARSRAWDFKRETIFAGVYQEGGRNHTKNLQLATKLSNILGEQITLQDLEAGMTDMSARYSGKSEQCCPQVWLGNTGRKLYMVGVTTTSKKG